MRQESGQDLWQRFWQALLLVAAIAPVYDTDPHGLPNAVVQGRCDMAEDKTEQDGD